MEASDALIFEVSVHGIPADGISADIVEGLLQEAGIDLLSVVEVYERNGLTLTMYPSDLKQMKDIRQRIRRLGIRGLSVQSKSLKACDWKTKWKDDFKPFMLTKRFMVVPSWLKSSYSVKKPLQAVYIDTSLAFGTGLHPTTRMMAGLIERCRGRFKSLCDIGTGTGILAIIASKCGGKHILGIDISQDAIKIARNNLLTNRCDHVQLKILDISRSCLKQTFDFVAANLVTHDLIDNQEYIRKLITPGGYLAVSGISVCHYPFFRQKFDESGLKCLKIERDEGWAAILYKML